MNENNFFVLEEKNLKIHKSNCPKLIYLKIRDLASIHHTKKNEIHSISSSKYLTEKAKTKKLNGLGYKYLGKTTQPWEAMLKAIIYYTKYIKDALSNNKTYQNENNNIKTNCINQGINKTNLSPKEYKNIIINTIIKEIQERKILDKINQCTHCIN